MPGVCWYPAKCTGHAVNQGGTADSVYSSLTEEIFCRGRFFMERKATGRESRSSRLLF